jgi:hypothetical protein
VGVCIAHRLQIPADRLTHQSHPLSAAPNTPAMLFHRDFLPRLPHRVGRACCGHPPRAVVLTNFTRCRSGAAGVDGLVLLMCCWRAGAGTGRWLAPRGLGGAVARVVGAADARKQAPWISIMGSRGQALSGGAVYGGYAVDCVVRLVAVWSLYPAPVLTRPRRRCWCRERWTTPILTTPLVIYQYERMSC